MGRFKGSRVNMPKGQPKRVPQPIERHPVKKAPYPPRRCPADYSTCATR
ncbi:hypothetical protein ACPV5A_13505 [Vibrio chagasii]